MRNTKSQFFGLLAFLTVACIVLTNGFSNHIFAQRTEQDIYHSIEPIGVVLHEIMDSYVEQPDIDKVVEGALVGMMNSLDDHSSYISPEMFQDLQEDTRGEFEGIGVQIKLDDDKNIVVFQPLENTPAFRAGVMAGDIIVKIDDVSAQGMSLSEAANLIKGPKGTVVKLTVLRRFDDGSGQNEILEFDIKRDSVEIDSIREVRMLDGGIGYLRLGDFKENSADKMSEAIEDLLDQGMRAFILDLRWNPGGLLTASKEVSELFLPKRTLVTYTKGRETPGLPSEEWTLKTEKSPVLPEDFPMVVLTSRGTASSAEIVTGALQYHARAIVVGETSYGKGSVQTIIPLRYPENAALRLTTALYYTPADVTINKRGIIPDVAVEMTQAEQVALVTQMRESYQDDPTKVNEQDHGSVTGGEATGETAEDLPLKRAVEILNEDTVFENLITKYHKDPNETQVANIAGDTAPEMAEATAVQ